MRAFTYTIPANGAVMCQCPGKYLSVKTCSLPITASFNGGENFPCKAGSVLSNGGAEFSYINFLNTYGVAVTLSIYVAGEPVTYAPDGNDQSNASSYILGNLGIAVSAAAAGGLPACDANGFLTITNAMQLTVAGTNNGHRRQVITFSLSSSSPAPLNLADANGCIFMTILAGQQVALVTDATFVLSGAGGAAWASVGQIFLNS